jgi:hypothetical protein
MARDDGDVTVEDLDGLTEIIEPKPERKTKSKTSSTGRKPPLAKRLTTMVELIGNVTSGFDKYDGSVIVDNAPKLAEALVELANESPRAKRVLEGMLEGGAWAGVGAVVGWEIVTPIALHHRMLPEPIQTNLAEIRGVPVKAPKAPKAPKLRAVPPISDDGEAPGYVMARDPKTGQEVLFPADGNGRPIFPPPDDDATG